MIAPKPPPTTGPNAPTQCVHTLRNGVQEDRSRDWVCSCGERNFQKRAECFRCKAPRTQGSMSYTGVSHLIEQQLIAQQAQRAPRPFGGPLGTWTTAKDLLSERDMADLRRKVDEKKSHGKKKRGREASSSSSSSESSAESSSESSEESAGKPAATSQPATKVNTELDQMKDRALQDLLRIKDEPLETRKKSWRALLLEWHPDKHPDDVDSATAVFQFLQKGKGLLQLKSN